MASDDEGKPKLQCEVTGPAFEGIEAGMHSLGIEDAPTPTRRSGKNTKLLLVHGMGPAEPGYSTRLQKNLSQALGLTVAQRRPKRINIESPRFREGPLGTLTVSRYMNKARSEEVLFYELTWAEIAEREKRVLAYDTSGQYDYSRASMNASAKVFLNERLADPLIYVGDSHLKILNSVDQAMCWMLYTDWDELPDRATQFCNRHEVAQLEDIARYQFVVITHSLGSRIMMDTMQYQAQVVMKQFKSASDPAARRRAKELLEVWKNEPIQFYMLANQLPLLQLGRGGPEVAGQIDSYCRPGGTHYGDRLVRELQIVAFSDPNDLLSYAIPPEYEDQHMDSRLCPKVVNVSLNIVENINLFGVGEMANPIDAHEGYENDERVIGLITSGIGHEHVDESVASGCQWIETVD